MRTDKAVRHVCQAVKPAWADEVANWISQRFGKSKMSESEELIRSLQGQWEDNRGLVINVDGREVDFNDGHGAWLIEVGETGLELRGASLEGGLPDLPVWSLSDGYQVCWTRPDPAQLSDNEWPDHFLGFKTVRLLLRRKLAEAMAVNDTESVKVLEAAWKGNLGIPLGASLERQARLMAGRFLVPGVIVRLRKHSCSGVILACEPWVGARLARRLIAGPGSRLEPLYHVLLDERAVAGDRTTLVPESEIEACDDAYPLKAGPQLGRLMIPNRELRGYLPGKEVMDALKRQLHGHPLHLRQPHGGVVQ